jgi:predicted permease
MSIRVKLLRILRSLFRNNRRERELSAELQGHLDLLIEEKIRAGMSPDQARRAARIELGGLEQVKEDVREAHAGAWLDSLFRDIRYGARSLRKSSGFTIVTIATLALVIGANTAIFSAFYGLVFRHLPYKNPDQLVTLWLSNRKTGREHGAISLSKNFAKNLKSFNGIAGVSLRDTGPRFFETTRLWGTQESVEEVPCGSSFFQVLKTEPLLGRAFQLSDDAANAPNVAVLTARFWRKHYGASNDVIGKTLSIQSIGIRQDFVVVGVMPDYVEFPYPLSPRQTDFWANLPREDGVTYTNAIARLNDGVSIRTAETEIITMLQGLPAQTTNFSEGDTIQVVPLRSELIRDVRSMLWILVAALGFVLLIGCANIANLLLVRGFVREKEFALRTALGAQRTTLIRQLFVEALLLAVCGGVAGFLLSYWGLRGFVALLPPTLHIPRFEEAAIDLRVIAITTAISMMAALLFGMFPTMRLGRINLNNTLKSGAVTSESGGPVLRRPGSLLLVGEIALALVLLAGTALLTQSFGKLLSTNARFQPEHLLLMDLYVNPDSSVSDPNWSTNNSQRYSRLLGAIAALPGVRSAALADPFPANRRHQFQALTGGGRIAKSPQPAEDKFVTPAFFQTLGYDLQGGRWFEEHDVPDSTHVALINQEMKQMYWPDANPIGFQLAWKPGGKVIDTYTIVGIVKEPPRFASGEKANPTVYPSLLQMPLLTATLLVRTQGDPRAITSMVREAASKDFIAGKDAIAGTSWGFARTGADLVSESTARLRFTMMLVSVFSGVALLLALIGIYGLISYYTAQRTREIGIRMALGATPAGVLKLVLQEGMALISAGAAIGLVVAYLFGRGLASLLYGVHPSDPISLLGAVVSFVAVASVAFYIPARRAMRVDPMVALRSE